MDETNLNKFRLSDRVFYALKLAVEQKDGQVATALVSVLELAMTRNSGGGEFVERRIPRNKSKPCWTKLAR